MSAATVVLCPPLPGRTANYDAAGTADALLDHPRRGGCTVLSPYVDEPHADDDARTVRAHWVAHLSIALATGGAVAPVLLVIDGSAGELAPALGFSQRAARRMVAGYVLVESAVPAADDRTADWPEAPVVYLASPSADQALVRQAVLRGWDVMTLADLSADAVAGAVVSIAAR